ncbi:MAG: outer membrane protein assembly factor BamB [Gammaproteobacteria bacterium]|nr:outer membrane protein assembly factor BamB [Gammaproteobacteria bacterium]MBQ0840484.1 outer membrane protein assembly factor BamB [Gammaproteobacteria bacterium]
MSRLFATLCCVLLLSACSGLWNDDSSADGEPVEDSEALSFDDAAFDDAAFEKDSFEEGDDEAVNNEPKELNSIEATVKIKKIWRNSIGSSDDEYQPTLHPAIGDGVVYAASNRGRISAWSIEKGKRLWRTDLDISLSGGVGFGAGLVVVGTAKGELIALDATTGEERWRVTLSSEILSAPAAQGDLLVAQTQDGKVYGLSVASGEEIWRYSVEVPVLTLRGTAGPLVTPRMVITGFANGKLVALNAATGALLWEAKLATGEGKSELEKMVDVNSPIMGNEVVYATSYQGRAGAFSRGTGRELWAQKSSSYHPPAFGLGRLFVADTEGQVLRLRSSGGRAEWTNTDLLRRGLTPPLAVGGYVLVADSEGFLHALSQADGVIGGRVKVDGDGVAVAMVSDGETIFVQDRDDDLSAYQLIAK